MLRHLPPRGILLGGSEYEQEFTVLTLRLDRACFVTWQRQMVKV